MDSFDDPAKELSLTCTVFSQYEQKYLPFLRNSEIVLFVQNLPETMSKHILKHSQVA